MVEAIGIGVFVFVVIVVAGFRALDTLKANSAKAEAERFNRVANRAKRGEYTGGYFNVHGREVE